jgi:hypothetical protein
MKDKLWHIFIYKDYTAKGDCWGAAIALTARPNETSNLFPYYFKTAKQARQEVDKMFPVITWVNAKKAYVRVEDVDND